MGYQNIALRFRPKRFKQVIGQPSTRVIQEVISEQYDIPPLILLSGPSGVGKTTLARIIATSVNCTDRQEFSEPCLKCPSCEATTGNQHPDVYETDAATKGGAEDLRRLVERVHTQSRGKSIVILDEAHAISAQGWNVLLKVLEEPPPNSLFILLTSEPQKVPMKIRTRALSFKLGLVAPKILRQYLAALAKHQSLEVSNEDIEVIVNECEGSVREALMMLEHCALSTQSAQELFKGTDKAVAWLEALAQKDLETAHTVMSEWWDEVGDVKEVLSHLATAFEQAVLMNQRLTSPDTDTLRRYKSICALITLQQLAVALETLSDWYPITFTKPQLTLLTSAMFKTVHGPAVSQAGTGYVRSQPPEAKQSDISVEEALQKVVGEN